MVVSNLRLFLLIKNSLKAEVIQDSSISVHSVGSVDPEFVILAPLLKVIHLFQKLTTTLLR